MKNYYTPFTGKQITIITLLVVVFIFIPNLVHGQSANVPVPFTPRTSPYQNNKEVYKIRGDYALIGNTNMTLNNYGLTTLNSNNQMIYIDVDGDPNTLNSSSATLEFSNENDALPECAQIIYAGLYWAGRAHNTTMSDNTFSVTKTIQGILSQEQVISHGNSIPGISSYTLTVSTQSSNSVVRYAFRTGSSAYTYVEFTDSEPYIRYGTSTGSINTYATTYSVVDENGNRTVTFRPIEIVTIGGNIITVDQLTRIIGTATATQQQNAASVRVKVGSSTSVTKQYDKSSVWLKHADAAQYLKIDASDNNFTESIYYPSTDGTCDMMYVGYQDITTYVQQYGVGEYTVADIALIEGNGGSVGFYGSWGIVVVYENAALPMRNIVLFDGFAYISSGDAAQILTVDGISTVQEGNVNMKIGIMASEGDVDILGDYFQIAKQSNGVPLTGINDYSYLNRSGQVYTPANSNANNFFNSSVQVSNARYPEITNNTGIDIALFNIPNQNKEYVTNNQTSMRFRYGTSTDTYLIYCLVTAVDAYVPEPEALSLIKEVQGAPIAYDAAGDPIFNGYLNPGDTVTYTLEIRNKGHEAIDSLFINMPIAYTAEYLYGLTNVEYFWNSDSLASAGVPANNNSLLFYNPQVGTSGAVEWYVGDFVYTSDLNDSIGGLLAKLTFSLRVTENCHLLTSSNNCVPDMVVYGQSSGRGHSSGISFKETGFIYGHHQYPCDEDPITIPHALPIAVSTLCTEDEQYQARTIQFCVERTETPYLDVAQYFATGSRFYNKIDINTGKPPEDDPTVVEYTANTNFPAAQPYRDPVKTPYYAVPDNPYSTCYWTFYLVEIPLPEISVIGENTTVCQNEEVNLNTMLTIKETGGIDYPADLGYTNLFYTDAGGMYPLDSILTISETMTYYYVMTQIDNSQCFSSIEPLEITALPVAIVSQENSLQLIDEICSGETFNINPQTILGNTIIPIGTTYTWNTPAAISGISGLANGLGEATISGRLIDNNVYPVDVIYTVTPATTHTGGKICEGEPFNITVTVNPVSTSSVNISAKDTVICAGNSIDLTQLVSATGVTNPVFYWYTTLNGDVNVSSTTIHYPTAGTYSYYVAVSGESLCEGEANAIGRKEVKVTVNPVSTSSANISVKDTIICAGNSIDLTQLVSATGVTNPVFYWYTTLNGDVNVSSTTIHYPTAGTYSYYVAVSGESLCEGEASAIGRKEVKVTVNKYATALDLNINGETTICYEETATLTVTSVATPSIENPVYRWYASSTSTTPFFIGNVYTTTALLLDSTFYISVLGDNYCENEVNDRASVTITVTKKSTASNLSISGKTTVCIGENTTLTASVTAIPAIENPVYRWYASPANETPFYIGNIYTTTALTSDTTFYISVSGDNHCENDANIAGRKMVTISVLPYSTLSMLTFTGDSICSGKPAMLTASAPSVENPVFRWYASASGDDLVFTGTPFITPELSKDTTYYLTVLGDNYCETIERAAVNVSVVCFTLKGTLFPFVYTGDEEFDTLFVLNAELFSVPPANSPDPIDEILESLPLHTVRAKHYDGSEHVHGTPKYPGYISSTDNPGEPISWHYIGKEKGEVDNTLLEEEDTPDQPVGLYRFDSIRRGDYILVLSRYGFISKFIKITVNDNMILGHRELIPGDVNGDLEVNAHDISFLISKYSSFGSTKYNAKYDLNGDGNIDGVDVSIIRFVINAHMGMYYDTEQWLLEY